MKLRLHTIAEGIVYVRLVKNDRVLSVNIREIAQRKRWRYTYINVRQNNKFIT